MANEGTLKIVELRAENVKRLKAVAVRPTGHVVPVSGKNRQGKTSLLDSIGYLFEGKGSHPREVIRRGEESAMVLANLGDLVVERRWRKTEKGEETTVVVRGADGARYEKPQAILDALYSHTTDPVGFMELDAKEQGAVLKELTPGLNFGPLDGKRADLYERRTEVNRKGGDLKARFLALAAPTSPLPATPIDLGELLEQQKGLRAKAHENELERRALENLQNNAAQADVNLQSVDSRIEVLRRELEGLEKRRVDLVDTNERLDQKITAQKTRVAALVEPDFGAVEKQVREAEQTNLAVMRERDRKKLEGELEQLRSESKALSDAIDAIDKEKTEKLAAVKFPVEGLGISDAGATFNGFPLSEASGAEQLRVSVAIALARKPRLRVLRVKDGSKLDSDGMKLLEQLAGEHDAQIWIERVADKDAVGVVIEDGSVAGADAETPVRELVAKDKHGEPRGAA